MIEGIDVSHHQGAIDWPVGRREVRFAYIKATEGRTFVDPRFTDNWRGARAAGVIPGAYHFARPGRPILTDAQAEASHFASHLTPGDPMLPPALDLEVLGRLDPGPLGQWVEHFVMALRDQLDVLPAIYVSPAFARRVEWGPQAAACFLWVAHWTAGRPLVPSPWKTWTFHQYTSRGEVEGIKGRVDRNRFNGSILALLHVATPGLKGDHPVPGTPEGFDPTDDPIRVLEEAAEVLGYRGTASVADVLHRPVNLEDLHHSVMVMLARHAQVLMAHDRRLREGGH